MNYRTIHETQSRHSTSWLRFDTFAAPGDSYQRSIETLDTHSHTQTHTEAVHAEAHSVRNFDGLHGLKIMRNANARLQPRFDTRWYLLAVSSNTKRLRVRDAGPNERDMPLLG